MNWNLRQLDVRAFARSGAVLNGSAALVALPRLQAEQSEHSPKGTAPEVQWSMHGEIKDQGGGAHQTWLHLKASITLCLICQRCLAAMEQPLQVDRSFRFVASEQTADSLDLQSEEDLLCASPQFDALTLIEDELILALPLVARHSQCPI